MLWNPRTGDSTIFDGVRRGSFDNTDDIEAIAILLAIVACSALVGVVLALGHSVGRRLIARRRLDS